MKEIKDGIRSQVRIGFDGRVHKHFKAGNARKRYENEKRILHMLEERGCPYVPRVLEEHDQDLHLVTTNCGKPVDRITQRRMNAIFKDLEENYGVIHDDQAARNITYDTRRGGFCVIDFELASTIEDYPGKNRKNPPAQGTAAPNPNLDPGTE